jgi:hypothetical protein
MILKMLVLKKSQMNAHLSFFNKMSSGDIHTMLIESCVKFD